MLSAGDLPLEPIPLRGQSEAHFLVQLGSSVYEVERELIVRTVAHAKGNKMRAAEILGISRRNLYNRLHRYEVRESNSHLNGHSYRNGRDGRS